MANDVHMKGILKQWAVYWKMVGRDNNGQPLYGTPIEVKCRWEDMAKLFIGKDGTESVSRAEVFVDRDLVLDGVLWLGTLNQIESDEALEDPFLNENAWSIRYFKKLPTRSAKKFVRIAVL